MENSEKILVIMSKSYFKRCSKELRWARDAGKEIIVCCDIMEKPQIEGFLNLCPQDLISIGIDFIDLNQNDLQYWEVGIKKILDAQPKKLDPAPQETKESKERILFFRFSRVILDVLPHLLREFFKRRWDAVHPEHPWLDDAHSGTLFWNGSTNATVALPGTLKVKAGSGTVGTTEDLTLMLSPGDVIVVEQRRWKLLSPKPNEKQKLFNKDRVTLTTQPDIDGDFEAFALDIGCELNAPPIMEKSYKKHVLPGDRSKWDISLLTFALVNSSHELLICEAMQNPLIKKQCGSCATCAARGAVQEFRPP